MNALVCTDTEDCLAASLLSMRCALRPESAMTTSQSMHRDMPTRPTKQRLYSHSS